MPSSLRQIRIEYHPGKCIGNQECVKRAPLVFRFDSQSKKAILVGGREENSVFTVGMAGDESRVQRTIDAAASCPVNAFRVVDLDTNAVLVGNTIQTHQAPVIRAKYDDAKDFVLDPQGYFLIRVNHETKTIEAGFCNAKNTVVLTISGKKPIDIYHTLATSTHLELRKEHYAYLGRELEKAYHCLLTGLEYVQDDELHAMKPRKR